ncbi:MAG: hypothetical protein Q7R41_10980, partial [Phycisphaerales bacterium]|nr:hypothetical protein [Phycisphaerales bacterium]
ITEGRPEMKDGTIASVLYIDVSPSPSVEGGRITVPGTLASITLAQSHNPNSASLVGEQVYFTSGPASGGAYGITAWNGIPTRVATVSPTFAQSAVPSSGNPYNLIKKSGPYAGFDLFLLSNPASESEFAYHSTIYGTTAAVPLEAQLNNSVVVKVVPFSDGGIRNEIGPWITSLTTYGDTEAPPQPRSLSITQPPGAGAQIKLQVLPTSVADLWGHLFYRHTANSFTLATTIGFGSQTFYDTNISYETSYYYWAAPVDYSFNVGSFIGPVTFVASRIITTDVATQDMTFAQFVNEPGGVPAADVPATTCGSPIIILGPLGPHALVTFNCNATNNAANNRTINISFLKSIGGAYAVLDQMVLRIFASPGGFISPSWSLVDSIPSGIASLGYKITCNAASAPESGDVVLTSNNFSVIEYRR